jgi:acyl-CoA-dependent ceramide synthase
MDQEKHNMATEQEREAAQEWLHRNGDNVASIEQKLNLQGDGRYPEQALHVTRKSRRQDDGALEVFCSWVIRHQIGNRTSSPASVFY